MKTNYIIILITFTDNSISKMCLSVKIMFFTNQEIPGTSYTNNGLSLFTCAMACILISKPGYTPIHTRVYIYTYTNLRSGKTLVLVGRGSYRSQVRALVMEELQRHIMDKLSRLDY